MRSIKKIHDAEYSLIGDLITYSPLPTENLEHIDPFLFLNHHGPQVYPPQNNGLPFGPHPHRGMETVTFIMEGDILHKDTGGHESIINTGGVQWMTAGKGLIHAEYSSRAFKQKGGNLEILQLWINLPAKLKSITPYYTGKQKEEIPIINLDNGNIAIDLISGDWENNKGAFESLTNVFLSTIFFKFGSKLKTKVSVNRNIFFYMVRGNLIVNNRNIHSRQLAEFNNDNEEIEIAATSDCVLLFGHAEPFNEPIVAQGPFVMNTVEEIQEAYSDYRKGKYGNWNF